MCELILGNLNLSEFVEIYDINESGQYEMCKMWLLGVSKYSQRINVFPFESTARFTSCVTLGIAWLWFKLHASSIIDFGVL